jgi:hypothetical protein
MFLLRAAAVSCFCLIGHTFLPPFPLPPPPQSTSRTVIHYKSVKVLALFCAVVPVVVVF